MDPEPQPGDGPEYHADHAFWSERVSLTETGRYVGRILAERDGARAELSRLRDAVQDLAHKWEMFALACEPEDPATRPRLPFEAAAGHIRAALAVSSSAGAG